MSQNYPPSSSSADDQPTTPLAPYEAPAYQTASEQAPEPAPQSVQPMQPPLSMAPAPIGTTLASTNTYALISIILSFTVPLAGIIFGHLALSQIKRTGDSGRGIALVGTIVGYASFALIALLLIFYVGMIFIMIGSLGAAFSGIEPYMYDDYSNF